LKSIYAHIYFWLMGQRAKIFPNGGSQAVRLPKSFRFRPDQEEVMVRRVGRKIILEPVDEWSQEFLACLGAWRDDIPRPATRPIGEKKDPFNAT